MKTIKDVNYKNKNILARVDFNVPIDSKGKIIDDTRIKATLPTIKAILNGGAKRLVLMCHLGRPVIRYKEDVNKIISGNKQLNLAPIAKNLADWLKSKQNNFKHSSLPDSPLPVYKISDKLYLMENIRFLEGENKYDENLCKTLSKLGDIFVFDAFGTAHHASCSVSGISKYLPSYVGLLVQKEVEHLKKLFTDPARPFVIILGGAKIAEKILVLKNLINKADYILLGGVMANTFLVTRGADVKRSYVEKQAIEVAEKLINKTPKKFILPMDIVWNKQRIVDIGPTAILDYQKYILKAKTVFLNGPMGLITNGMDNFPKGTHEIIKVLAKSSAKTIISGGDTIAEVSKLKLSSKISYISTGGGATLEFLAGNKLPGLEALK